MTNLCVCVVCGIIFQKQKVKFFGKILWSSKPTHQTNLMIDLVFVSVKKNSSEYSLFFFFFLPFTIQPETYHMEFNGIVNPVYHSENIPATTVKKNDGILSIGCHRSGTENVIEIKFEKNFFFEK